MLFNITGMTCDHCVQTLATALAGVDGVAKSEVRLSDGTARVVLDEATCGPQEITEAVRGAGFQVTGFSQAD